MREHLVNLALKLVGCPYIWGGANPWTGFDCSGFVIWIYQVFGLLPSGDWTAQGLYEHFVHDAASAQVNEPRGGLAFYGPDCNSIRHVMLRVDKHLVVGASGGGSDCTTREVAHVKGAMVKVKPFNYRADLRVTLNVAMPGE
jgi:cell wall-associated NlpC family hydrolase